MKKNKTLVKSTINSLEKLRDANRIEFAKKSYPTALKVIGVTVPNEKEVLKELKKHTKTFSQRQKIELAKDLVNTNIFECQHMAYELIGKDKKALKELTESDIIDYGKCLDNWILVDCYATYLVGYAWRENIISTTTIKSYLNSDDYWMRRIAIVATISLNQKARGGNGDAKRTLEICHLVITDHEDMIIKALSWALRELIKIDKKPVIDFIDKYKNELHPKVLREVNKKLMTGTKG